MGAVLKGVEYVLGSRKISNGDLTEMFPDYDFRKFEDRVGIKYRYWTDSNETALDLAEAACKKLFERFDKSTIDYIIYCTQSPEYILPTTACLLQQRLDLEQHVGAYDFNLGCSGYVYGLSMAYALIASKQVNSVLLVTAETYSKFLNPLDKSNRAIFGDAASASLIEQDECEGFGKFSFGTDGSGYDKLIIRNGGTKNPYSNTADLKQYGSENFFTDNDLYMNGPEIFNFTSKRIPPFTVDLLSKNELSVDDVDLFVFHQANAFMLDSLRKKMKISSEKFVIDLEDGGNTVSCTIPIALKRSCENIVNPLTIVVVGFGVGLSWAGGLIKITNSL